MDKKIFYALGMIVLVIAVVFKVVIIFYSPLKYTDADESAIGIMAKHIMENGEVPFFQIGHSFGGDMVVQSLIAVPFFMFFGVSTFSLHLEAIFLSICVIIAAYLARPTVEKIARERFGERDVGERRV